MDELQKIGSTNTNDENGLNKKKTDSIIAEINSLSESKFWKVIEVYVYKHHNFSDMHKNRTSKIIFQEFLKGILQDYALYTCKTNYKVPPWLRHFRHIQKYLTEQSLSPS